MDEFIHISETYDWTERAADDVLFYVNLAKQIEGTILEIGAGTGRIAIPLAELGRNIIAFDISESMLNRARTKWKTKGNGHNLRFIIGDFRFLSLDECFGLILSPARIFEHAISDLERESSFLACARHLRPSGKLALHVWGPPLDENSSTQVQSRLIEPANEHGLLRFSWHEERDFAKEIRRHFYKIEELDGQKRKWIHEPIEVRWYSSSELDRLGKKAGLRIMERFGGFKGQQFNHDCLQMVWIYEKEK